VECAEVLLQALGHEQGAEAAVAQAAVLASNFNLNRQRRQHLLRRHRAATASHAKEEGSETQDAEEAAAAAAASTPGGVDVREQDATVMGPPIGRTPKKQHQQQSSMATSASSATKLSRISNSQPSSESKVRGEEEEEEAGGTEQATKHEVEERHDEGGSRSCGRGGGDGSGGGLDLRACCCALMGKVLAKQDKFERAVFWLATALRIDPACLDAFECLVGRRLLSGAEEEELIGVLPWRGGGEDDWLQAFYKTKVAPHRRSFFDSHHDDGGGGGGCGTGRPLGTSAGGDASSDAELRFEQPALRFLLGQGEAEADSNDLAFFNSNTNEDDDDGGDAAVEGGAREGGGASGSPVAFAPRHIPSCGSGRSGNGGASSRGRLSPPPPIFFMGGSQQRESPQQTQVKMGGSGAHGNLQTGNKSGSGVSLDREGEGEGRGGGGEAGVVGVWPWVRPRSPNVAVLAAKAELLWAQHDPVGAHSVARACFEAEPLSDAAVPVLVAAMLELKLKPQLFLVAHQVVTDCLIACLIA
jgi:hypothetical protein